jgi:hypothetical protein
MLSKCVRAGAISLFCAMVLLSSNAFAGVYSFTSAPIEYDSQLSLGFTFTTNTDITVYSLGYYDYQGDGFATPHEVGIFDSLGNLLTSTTLSVGTVDALGGNDFRYQAITPITLGAGQTFTIAGTSDGTCTDCVPNNDPWAYGGPDELVGFVVSSAISIGLNAAVFNYQSDNILRDPLDHFSDYQIYAVNFNITSGVPEAATWAMMLLGFASIGFVAYRRAKKRSAAIPAA